MQNKVTAILLGIALGFVAWGITPTPSVFAANTCASTASGNWSATSTWTGCGNTVPQNGDSVVIALGHTVTVDANSNNLASLTVNGTLTWGADNKRIDFDGTGSFTVNGAADFGTGGGSARTANSGAMILTMGASGLIRTADSDGLSTKGSLREQGAGVWNLNSLATNGTVEYYGANAQTITDLSYNNLVISGSNTKTWTLTSPRTLNGSLTLSESANFTLANSTLNPLNVNGDWTHSSSGTFTHTGGTVLFAKNGTATLSKAGLGVTSTETFCRLTISVGTLLDTTDDFVAVSGSGGGCSSSATLSGALRRETPAQNVTNGGGAVDYRDSKNAITARITQTGGSNFGNTPVTVTINQSPVTVACGGTALGGAAVLRHFNIAPQNISGVTATIRLYFNNNELNNNQADSIAIYHCDGTTWTRLGGTTGSDANGNYVELAGITTFSPFAIGGSPSVPTAVTLSSFDARGNTDSEVLPVWGIALTGILLASAGGGWILRRRPRSAIH